MIDVFNELSSQTSDYPFALDTKVLMSDNDIDNITRAEAMGREQYATFGNHTSLRWINHSMIILRKTVFNCLNQVKGKIYSKSKNKVKNMKSGLHHFQKCI